VDLRQPGLIYRTIGTNEPQLFVDDHLIENRYTEDVLSARVPHELHPPRSRQLVLAPDEAHPWEQDGMTYPSALYDPQLGRFRLYYQLSFGRAYGRQLSHPTNPEGRYATAYAESDDGITWERPLFDHVPYGEHARTNIVVAGKRAAALAGVQLNPAMAGGDSRGGGVGRAGGPLAGTPIRTLGSLPPQAFRGSRFLMLYSDGPHFLATSEDGIRWHERRQTIFPYHMDALLQFVYDETLPPDERYVLFPRPRNLFTGQGPKRGNLRIDSRMVAGDIWQEWNGISSSILIPDAGDGDRYYGKPTFRHAGIYWGFLWHLHQEPEPIVERWGNGERIDVELVTSRDGIHWQKLFGAPRLLSVGEPGTWDCGMILTGERVIEVGDEWWLYYGGWNGPHRDLTRQGAIGLARWRKEGFVSVRADSLGQKSYLVTRVLRWPGGDLQLNAAARDGFVRCAVTDPLRDPIEGFGYDDGGRFTGDATRHPVRWGSRSLSELQDRFIRLEFEFVHADLFGFVAAVDDDGMSGMSGASGLSGERG
jgi:hypothetical protein